MMVSLVGVLLMMRNVIGLMVRMQLIVLNVMGRKLTRIFVLSRCR